MMRAALAAALHKAFPTLRDPSEGRLLGEGDPSAIVVDSAKPGRVGVLALHGFAGTPLEVQLVTDVAARLELSARAPRLAGHGPDPRTLMDSTWADWTLGVERSLFELGETSGAKVVVCGMSLGSLLATYLAATYPERVAGLVVLSNALQLRLLSPRLPLAFCQRVKPFGNRFYTRKAGADIRDPEARRVHRTYDVNPMKSAVEVLVAGRVARALLPRVRCPTLIIHGRFDQVCPVANASRFARGVGTRDVEIAIMPNSGHIVTEDLDRREVARHLESFLRRVAG